MQNDDVCSACGDGGELICCETCPRCYHTKCLELPNARFLPDSDWSCPSCTQCPRGKFAGLGDDAELFQLFEARNNSAKKKSKTTAGNAHVEEEVDNTLGEGGGVQQAAAAAAAVASDAVMDSLPLRRRAQLRAARGNALRFARGDEREDERGGGEQEEQQQQQQGTQEQASPSVSQRSRRGRNNNNNNETVGSSSNEESWPGPWSTAMDLLEKRTAAAAKREAIMAEYRNQEGMGKAASEAKERMRISKAKNREKKDLSLLDLAMNVVSDNIASYVETGLGCIPSHLLAKLTCILTEKRKLTPDVLPLVCTADSESLEIPDCSFLDDLSLEKAILSCGSENLLRVSLGYCGRGMTGRLFAQLGDLAPNVQVLELSGCYLLGDEDVAQGLHKLPHLESLCLADCALTGAALRNLSSVQRGLRQLSLVRMQKFKGSDYLDVLGNLAGLEVLNLNDSAAVEDDVVVKILQVHGPTLEILNLGQWAASATLTDAVTTAIASNCPRLLQLDLSECGLITPKGIMEIASGCRKLEEMCIGRCVLVDDEAVALLGTLPLRRLVINSLPLVSDAGLINFAAKCTTLQSLDCSFCRLIGDEGLLTLCQRNPNLTEVRVRGSRATEIFAKGHASSQLCVVGVGFWSPLSQMTAH